ncbi:MAG: penicillin-binding protein 1C [Prevotellaceae bacterium]|nr:penicillin-binding protein 1C [Prevotellaceae bacterium]
MKNWRKYRLLGLFALLGAGYWFSLPAGLFRDPASTIVESADGHLLGAKIAADGQWRFPAQKIGSIKYAICLMAYEDKHFMQHKGIDFLAIGRAFWHNLRQGKIVEGGSTISMQVIRLMRKGKPRTIKEKIIECILATRLEWRYTKREILELYMAHAPFGGNVVGVEAAAWRYFGRSSQHLSWAEAAMLAVLPNAPALIHPGRNRSTLLKKRNTLLDDLCRLGLLNEEDKQLAQLEPLPDKPFALPMLAPHVVERLAKTKEGERAVTTIDYFLQQHATQVVNTHAEQLRGNSVHNAAAVIIDNRSGGVLAYIGNVTGRNNKEYGEDVDLIMAPRSTGSILKPFLYAGLIDEGDVLPNTLVPDVPTFLSGFAPQNFKKSFDGAVPVHEALERSLNVPWVRLLQDFGLNKFYVLLKKMGITSLKFPSEHYGLSLILGGAEASLWDICSVYASMSRTLDNFTVHHSQYAPNDWRKPVLTPQEQASPVAVSEDYLISAAACWLVFDALSEVQRPEEEAEWKTFPSSRRVAWKTGTSYGNRDAWAVGVTPHYTVGVWVGNASGEGRPMLTGVGSAAPVLFDLFNLLPPTSWYAQPFDEMTHIAVCRKSGHRATALCEETDSMWVASSGLDTPPCPYHVLVHLDRHGKYRVNADCEEAHHIISRSWFVLPPVQEWYYRTKHYAYKPLPPVDPRCATVVQQRPMALIYPENGLAVVLTKQMSGELGKIELQATHRRRSAIMYWHLDEVYLGATQYFHSMPVTPSAGLHTITLVDDEGLSLTSRFRVEKK